MILISACLAGLNTRYDGTNCGEERFKALLSAGKAIPICPEQLGDLPTPREPVELIGGDGDAVLNGEARAIGQETGKNYTSNFINGADRVLDMIETAEIDKVILKDGSPSCGSTYIKREGKRITGRGVTTAALLKAGVKIESG